MNDDNHDEYNNALFIQEMCQKLGLDMKDTFSYFLNLRQNCGDKEMFDTFEQYEISKLDINRIYRYLDKYTDKNCAVGTNDDNVDIDEQTALMLGSGGDDLDGL